MCVERGCEREAQVQAARVRADRIRTSIYSRAVAMKCIERSAKRVYSENRTLL